jgi:hypothetical protein
VSLVEREMESGDGNGNVIHARRLLLEMSSLLLMALAVSGDEL